MYSLLSTSKGWTLFLPCFNCDFFGWEGWDPGIEGRLTRERDSEAKAVRTDGKSQKKMKN